jgi:Protein of unknown function (DUF3551)
MSRFSILSATCIAALSAWTFVAFATPASAHTYEYCRRDIIGYTLSCGFDTLAQCQRCPQAVAAIPLSAMCAKPMHSHQSADKRSAF